MRKDKYIVIEALLDANMTNGIELGLLTKLSHDFDVSIEAVSDMAYEIYKAKKFNGELQGREHGKKETEQE